MSLIPAILDVVGLLSLLLLLPLLELFLLLELLPLLELLLLLELSRSPRPIASRSRGSVPFWANIANLAFAAVAVLLSSTTLGSKVRSNLAAKSQ